MEAEIVAYQSKGAREAQVLRLEAASGPDVYFVILTDKDAGVRRHLFCQGDGLRALGQGVEWAIRFVEQETI
jgi:hypothetical protein